MTDTSTELAIKLELLDPTAITVRNIRQAKPSQRLIDSIREHGVRQPIGVLRTADGELVLQFGDRRRQSCIEVGRDVPAIVVDGTAGTPEAEIARIFGQLDENDNREDLTSGERALAVATLFDYGVDATEPESATLPPGVLGYGVGVFPGNRDACSGLAHTGVMTAESARREAAQYAAGARIDPYSPQHAECGYRPVEIRAAGEDWARVGKHAAPQAIEARLKTARRARGTAQRLVDRWEALLEQRMAQVAAGEWPPPVERVTWADLRPGDVITDPDDKPVLEVERESGGEWVMVLYDAGDGTAWHMSAPAEREVPIRPRVEAVDRG